MEVLPSEIITTHKEMSSNVTSIDTNEISKKPKVKKFKSIMDELLKPPPKEEKPNIHLSGGGVFKKLDKI
jgi:hypothetical protein